MQDHFYGYEFLEKEKGLITSFGKGKSAYYEILLRVSKNSTVLVEHGIPKSFYKFAHPQLKDVVEFLWGSEFLIDCVGGRANS